MTTPPEISVISSGHEQGSAVHLPRDREPIEEGK